MNVALVTCRELPESDPDQELLLEALRQTGLQADLLAWDDPQGDPAAFDLCVLRSCWNYYEEPETFLSWIGAAASASKLVNPEAIVRWNLHKTYLRELADKGIPIIPTAWFPKGQRANLAATMLSEDWDDVVVKPVVSAASYRTRRFDAKLLQEGQAFLEDLVQERDAMVQRYIPSVESMGERSLVSIDGELTHSVRKKPRYADGEESVSAAVPISAPERSLAAKALGCVDGKLLYGRVDIFDDDDGSLLVSELELMEPSLYLLQSPHALERFVAAIRDMG